MRMRVNKWCKGLTMFLVAYMLIGMYSSNATASDYKLDYNANTSENDYIFITKSPKGAIGKSMPIPFRIRATDEGVENLCIGLLQANEFQQIEERGNGDYSTDYHPSEIMETTFVAKSVGTIKGGNVKSVSLSARVRRDAFQRYYSIPILLEWDSGSDADYINVWVSILSTSGTDEEEDKKEGNCFVVGESQPMLRGVYPNIMDHTASFRNKRETTAQDVTVSIQFSKDDAKFSSEINDGNYDRTFERVQPRETVSAPYNMTIRKDPYMGYYPVKYTITFRLSPEGDLHTEGGTFYIHIVSKDKEDNLGSFSANDRTRTRLTAESYHMVPEKIYVEDEFGLILNMENASALVPASSIPFNLESEKVSDSTVFTMEPGTSSLMVDNMAPGQITKVRTRFTTRTGVDQRFYATMVREKYDSPEFKNVEGSIVVDIPIRQYARLSTSTIDVMSDSLTVGSESNVMFGINNTGRVILYNTTVTFETDSTKTTDTYVENTKPGETGDVDAMLTGVAPTPDEGTVRIRIDYEDEDGVSAEPAEEELTLMVMEETERNWDDVGMAMDTGNMDAEATPSFWSKYESLVVTGVVAVADIVATVVIRIRKKRKAAREEDVDDEIF